MKHGKIKVPGGENSLTLSYEGLTTAVIAKEIGGQAKRCFWLPMAA